jgi:hypothetical protein
VLKAGGAIVAGVGVLGAAGAGSRTSQPATPAAGTPATASPATGTPERATPSGGGAAARDPRRWPFAQDSIWNTPIGSGAVYVAAGIQPATEWGMTVDEDVIVMAPDAPLTDVYENLVGWSDRTPGARCPIQGELLARLPIPTDWVYPHTDGTPNAAAAVLKPNGRTVHQSQPFHRCTAGEHATSLYLYPEDDILTGDGIEGAHGGSGMSSLGGTVRIGELVPGGVIRHALKVNLFAGKNFFYRDDEADGRPGYRWPAQKADGYASESTYLGGNPALQIGSLLALPPSVAIDVLGLETEPAGLLAGALRDYGAYVVDDTAWDVYGLAVEAGPAGRVRDEFQRAWGFALTPEERDTPWARDMDRLFTALHVVDNNAPGSIGGGGTPRAPLAPPFASTRPSGKPA